MVTETAPAVTPATRGARPAKPPIPAIIKRNTILIAASQVSTGMGMGLLPTLGSLMVYQMLGSATFAGSATVLQGVARFIVAYPAGVIADRYGRRPAMMAGVIVASAATAPPDVHWTDAVRERVVARPGVNYALP